MVRYRSLDGAVGVYPIAEHRYNGAVGVYPIAEHRYNGKFIIGVKYLGGSFDGRISNHYIGVLYRDESYEVINDIELIKQVFETNISSFKLEVYGVKNPCR